MTVVTLSAGHIQAVFLARHSSVSHLSERSHMISAAEEIILLISGFSSTSNEHGLALHLLFTLGLGRDLACPQGLSVVTDSLN